MRLVVSFVNSAIVWKHDSDGLAMVCLAAVVKGCQNDVAPPAVDELEPVDFD